MKLFCLFFVLFVGRAVCAEDAGILGKIESALGFGDPATEAPPGILDEVKNITLTFLNSATSSSDDSVIGSFNETKEEESEQSTFLSPIFNPGSSSESSGKSSAAVDPFTSDICKSCKCIDTDPFFIDCASREIQEIFLPLAWPQNSSLVQVDVSFDDNQLTTVTQFAKLPIVHLSMRRNSIKVLQGAAFKSLELLEYLDLSENLLTHESLTRDVFQGQYSELEYEPLNLKTLKLGYNNIHSLDHDAFDHLPFLENLELNNNPLQVIDHQTAIALTSLRKLKKLNLAHTGLADLPSGVLHAIRGISALLLNGNQFEKIPDELKRATNLKYLNLNENPLDTLASDSFQGLENLHQLNISAMEKLRSIGPGTFTPLKSLKELWCTFNPALKKIHGKAFEDIADNQDSFNLRVFHFRGNAISTLPQGLLPWDSLDVIDIEENPYTCAGKSNEWIKDKLIPIIDDKSRDLTLSILCNTPEVLKGTPLTHVDFQGDCDDSSENDSAVNEFPLPRTSSFTTAVMVIATTAAIVIIAGVVAMGYFAVKRRGMQPLYQSPGQFVRYVRAQTDEFGDKRLQDDERAILPQDQMYRDEP